MFYLLGYKAHSIPGDIGICCIIVYTLIIMDGDRNHSMGSPVHRTPHSVITLTIHYDQQLHTAIIQCIIVPSYRLLY